MAKSIMDYIFRWLASKFMDGEAQYDAGLIKRDPVDEVQPKKVLAIAPATPRGGAPVTSISSVTSLYQQDAPPCPDCGAIMIRSGACYKCMNCGAVSGCS
jgi:ribonucleoside-diphosphate reductase alpha chain